MKITRELKYAAFEYDEDTNQFRIYQNIDVDTPPMITSLNKVYAFALMRFIVRIAQRNWFRKKK